MASTQDALYQCFIDEALVVVGENEGVELLEGRANQLEELFFGVGRKRIAALIVNAHNLLVARDDAGLHGGYPTSIGEDAALADFGCAQTGAERAACFVIVRLLVGLFPRGFPAANDTEELDAAAESREIGGHVSCASQTIRLRPEIHNRNRRFGREAVRSAPKIAIEHEIAEHADVNPAEARQQAFETGIELAKSGDMRLFSVTKIIPG